MLFCGKDHWYILYAYIKLSIKRPEAFQMMKIAFNVWYNKDCELI